MTLLFNIGQAADRARLDAVALDAFRRFAASGEPIEHPEQLEARIRALEAAVARGESAEVADDTPAPEGEPVANVVDGESPTSSDGTVGVALLISGGVVAGVGAVLIGVGAPDTGALTMPAMSETYVAAQARVDQGSALVASGLVSLGVGVVVMVLGAILTSSGASDSAAHLGPNGLEVTF